MADRNRHESPARRRWPKQERLDLLEILQILFQYRRSISLITLAAFALFLTLSLTLPKKYQSQISLLPSEPGENALQSKLADVFPAASLLPISSRHEKAELYFEILQSQRACMQVLNSELQFESGTTTLLKRWKPISLASAIKKLKKNTTLEITPAGIIQLHVISFTPKAADAFARAYVDALRNILSEQHGDRLRVTTGYIETQREQHQQKLHKLADSLLVLQNKYKIYLPNQQAEGMLTQLGVLKGEIVNKEIQIDLYQQNMREGNPHLQQARDELAALQARYRSLQSTSSRGEDALQPFQHQPAIITQVAHLQREVTALEHVWRFLTEQLYQLRLREKQTEPAVQLIDQPNAALTPVWPQPFWLTTLGTLFALILTIIFIYIREFFRYALENSSRRHEWLIFFQKVKRALGRGKIPPHDPPVQHTQKEPVHR